MGKKKNAWLRLLDILHDSGPELRHTHSLDSIIVSWIHWQVRRLRMLTLATSISAQFR